MLKNYVFYADKMLSDFKTFITNAGVYSTPVHNYDSVEVAGRNGNLLFEKNRFSNIEHLYPTIILEDFNNNFPALKSFLLSQTGYQRLSDTFYPDEFYMAVFSRFDDVKQPYLNGDIGSCVLVFDRKPQRYLKSGEKTITYTNTGSIKNPTKFKALPLLRVYGSGTLTINGIAIVINTTKQYLDIDCELQEVLQTEGNLDVTLSDAKFPYLSSGANEVRLGIGITRVDLTPRWWRL